jgi:hypothetical protein
MSRWKVTIHNATTVEGRLAHWWTMGQLFTECGRPCAYHDGLDTKLATGWISAPLEAIDCPECNGPRGL